MGNLYLGDVHIETDSMYLGDVPLFEESLFPITIDGVTYEEEDAHIFVANGNAVTFPCAGLPKFVAVNNKDVTPTSLSTIRIGEEQVAGATVETNSGDIVYAIFDWENPTSSWMHWFSEIKQFGLNSETGKRNQIKNGYRAFRHMRITEPGALPELDISNLASLNTMFLDSTFNVDISNWNTSQITNMGGTFKNATKFNQDLSEWCVSEIVSYVDFDENSGFEGQIAKHPQWGTCPRGENVQLPDGVLPDPYVTKDCHVFVANGNSVNLPCTGLPTFVSVNGEDVTPTTLTTRTVEREEIGADGVTTTTSEEVQVAAISANDKDIIHAIFDWNNNTAKQRQDWFSDILQFGSRSTGGEAEGYTNPTPLPSGRIPNQLKLGTYAFYYLGANPAAISTLDVSNLGNIAAMFRMSSEFNQNINNWDTSNITNMNSAFQQTAKFNKDLSAWDTSKVTQMEFMFSLANFNQDISGWDVSSVTRMNSMFNQVRLFNQDLSQWCVINITLEPNSFDYGTTQWTKPRPQWGTCPRGENTELPDGYELADCHIFVANGNEVNLPYARANGLPIFVAVNGVDVTPTSFVTRTFEVPEIGEDGEVTTTSKEVETTAISANPGDKIHAIFDWFNVNSAKQDWFSDILQFGSRSTGNEPEGYVNPPALASGRIPNQLDSGESTFHFMEANPSAIADLDVSNLKSSNFMFNGATNFNQDIGGWDVSNVQFMGAMFQATRLFNQDISGWNTSNVRFMDVMFNSGASDFNQDLSQWCVSKISSEPTLFSTSTKWTKPKPQWGKCP